MFKCCSNPKVKVVEQHVESWEGSSDTYTALVSCENCGKTKYTSNKATALQWAIYWFVVLVAVLIL